MFLVSLKVVLLFHFVDKVPWQPRHRSTCSVTVKCCTVTWQQEYLGGWRYCDEWRRTDCNRCRCNGHLKHRKFTAVFPAVLHLSVVNCESGLSLSWKHAVVEVPVVGGVGGKGRGYTLQGEIASNTDKDLSRKHTDGRKNCTKKNMVLCLVGHLGHRIRSHTQGHANIHVYLVKHCRVSTHRSQWWWRMQSPIQCHW